LKGTLGGEGIEAFANLGVCLTVVAIELLFERRLLSQSTLNTISFLLSPSKSDLSTSRILMP
jgi:hypothetical protein